MQPFPLTFRCARCSALALAAALLLSLTLLAAAAPGGQTDAVIAEAGPALAAVAAPAPIAQALADDVASPVETGAAGLASPLNGAPAWGGGSIVLNDTALW